MTSLLQLFIDRHVISIPFGVEVKDMSEYNRGFEDALDLVNHRIQNHILLNNKIKNELQEIIDRVKESKVVKIERELGF